MTIAECTLLGAVLLYLLTIGWAKAQDLRRFDNANPRDPAFYESGPRRRGLGAHQNGIEAFPLFAAAVLLAEFRSAPQHLLDLLAVAFLVVRLGYVFAYIADRATLRSILWGLAFAVNIAIFLMPWWAA